MRKSYRILVIDDDKMVQFTQKFIGHSIAEGRCEIVNFTDTECLTRKSKGIFEGLTQSFIDYIESNHIDIVACDLNLNDGEDDHGVHHHLIKAIREINKTLRLISYSGNLGIQIAASIRNTRGGEETLDEQTGKIIQSFINFSNKFCPRGQLVDSLNELLSEVNFSSEVEYRLIDEYSDVRFKLNSGNECSGLELAKLIRIGDLDGVKFLEMTFDLGISNILALAN